jgi:hypothetical protein
VAQRHLAGWPTPTAQPTKEQQDQRVRALALGAKD